MLLDKYYGNLGREFVQAEKNAQAAAKAMNATVLLRGKDDPKLGFFIGSAVILGPGKEVSYNKSTKKWSTTRTRFTVVVSALHNLSVNPTRRTSFLR